MQDGRAWLPSNLGFNAHYHFGTPTWQLDQGRIGAPVHYRILPKTLECKGLTKRIYGLYVCFLYAHQVDDISV